MTLAPKILPEFVLFGDSLTEWSFEENTRGFGLFLEKNYANKVTIMNEGQAGYTSSDLKDDFDRIISRATSPTSAQTLLVTIFLGANDACIIGGAQYVPWNTFEANIRAFVETILTQDALSDTKIVLITPPPIAIPAPSKHRGMTEEEMDDINEIKRGNPGFKTYMSKKRYADGILQIAKDYEETGRVVGLNYWRALVNSRLKEVAESRQESNRIKSEYNDEMPPGCGLYGAVGFESGWFTDGLHLDVKAYNVLSQELLKCVVGKWPELAPEMIQP